MRAAIKIGARRVKRIALRKWTAQDGTPPDGFYLDKIAPDGRVIDITIDPSGESRVYFLYREHANVLALDELWDEFDVLHGPIAPDNGV
jgi:hypothetical protein